MKVEAHFGAIHSHFDNDLIIDYYGKSVDVYALCICDGGEIFDEAYFTSKGELFDYADMFGFEVGNCDWNTGLEGHGYIVEDGKIVDSVDFEYDVLYCYAEA